MKTLTPQQIVDLNPCEGYDLEQVTELFDNKKSVTYLEILNTDKIPLEDIIWLFCQPTILDNDTKEQWLEVIVTRAVTNYALYCGINKVEKWAQNWLSGVDRTANSARSARDAAAYVATCYAARDAAADAARDAIYAAAFAATGYAAGAAAFAATNFYTAREIERKQQIQDLKDILQGESK